jgi:hypothetical protein
MLAGAGASALALTTGTRTAGSMTPVTGSVFEDAGGLAGRGTGRRGIAGVMVSNGRDVVRTDAEGRWRLSVCDGDSVFVIKPPHWSSPPGPGGVPRFARLHQPDGSRGETAYGHPGVAAAGTLPTSTDFALHSRQMAPSSATCATTSLPARSVPGRPSGSTMATSCSTT